MKPFTSPDHRFPAVSVVIPCYKQEAFLADAISSVQAQEYPECEIIIVDDGSPNDIRSCLKNFPGIQFIRQQNSGVAIARNNGLKVAKGSYVKFLDADDLLLPGALHAEVEYLEGHPSCAFVSGQVRVIDEAGNHKEDPSQPVVTSDHFSVLLQWNYIWTPGAVLYRRSVFETEAPFDPTAGRSEDYELNVRIASRHEAGCLNRAVLAYRQHGHNITNNYAYMLRSGIGVRKRFYPWVRHDRQLMKAWQTGLRSIQADLGQKVWNQAMEQLKAGKLDRRLV